MAVWVGTPAEAPGQRAADGAQTQAPRFQLSRAGAALRMTVGKSLAVSVPYPIRRISVADPAVGDVTTISRNEFLIISKAIGATNLIVWDEGDQKAIFDLQVTADVDNLARGIKELYPEEKLIIRTVKDTVVLSGEASREDVKKTVGALAESFAPKKVVNLVEVRALPDQVSLRVQIAEVSRSGARELGLGLLRPGRSGSNDARISFFPGKSFFTPFGNFRDGTGPDLAFGDLVNLFVSNGLGELGLFLRALEDRGELRTLAEPHLVTQNKQKASFLVGGEFPIPVPQNETVTIEFKPFGVRLDFTPTVVGNGRIELKLAPEVSDLDFSKSVSIGGISVPSLTKRRTETVVELNHGQTFAIAGLISQKSFKDLSGLPWVSDLPILGKLFSSERFNREESELLILVTPEIVKRAQADDPMPLPRGASLGRGM